MGLINKIIGGVYARFRSIYYSNRYAGYRNTYDISNNFIFQGTDIRLYGKGKIVLGSGSYMGTNSTMQSGDMCIIRVGDFCQISHNVRIYTVSANPNQDFNTSRKKPNITGDVIIGDGVWIGANVFINPGVIVGSNSVVGANAVITKNVEENTIVGGVPARLIKYKNLD